MREGSGGGQPALVHTQAPAARRRVEETQRRRDRQLLWIMIAVTVATLGYLYVFGVALGHPPEM